MALYGQILALAMRRQREADEEEGAVSSQSANQTLLLGSAERQHDDNKVDMDTGHLVLYIVLGLFIGLFAPVLLVVFWTEARLKCRRLVTGKRGGGREKKKKKKTDSKSRTALQQTTPLETIREEERGAAQLSTTNNTDTTVAVVDAGFPSQSHGGGNAAQGQVPQEKSNRACSI